MSQDEKISRKAFVKLGLVASAGLGLGYFWWSKSKAASTRSLQVREFENNSKIAHLMREGIKIKPEHIVKVPILIAGGGVSGLVAAMHLSNNNQNNFHLLELETQVGGNSIAGSNASGSFPWGAHYLPLPNLNQREMIEFLHKAGIVKSFNKDNIPEYEETNVCFDPEERLFKDSKWYEGLEPAAALTNEDNKQLTDFHQLMNQYAILKGKDGKDAFCIPVFESSQDEDILELDNISMRDFCEQKGFNSGFFNWYINYVCLDDYGVTADIASAWAGIHYFASRKGVASNVKSNQSLTWPEGNNRLVKEIVKQIKGSTKTHQLIYSISKSNLDYLVDVYDYKNNSYTRYETSQLIVALPHFVCKKIMDPSLLPEMPKNTQYFPWLVVNMAVDGKQLFSNSFGLAWDNVLYGKTSLGYVNASHQHLQYAEQQLNLTFYMPIVKNSPSEARQWLRAQSSENIKRIVLEELKDAHPNLEQAIQDVQYKIWGHAMIAPVKGYISERLKSNDISGNGLYFAHSDKSGISIFEEAFYHGIRSAKMVLKSLQIQ